MTITPAQIAAAAGLLGLDFTEAECEQMRDNLTRRAEAYAQIRGVALPNSVPPALAFRLPPGPPPALTVAAPAPASADDLGNLAFASLASQARLLRRRQVSSRELTELYLARLKRYDPQLLCVVTLAEELALAQAQRADAELARGVDRGPLHGIPWGAKDLLATRGLPTTWGAGPFRDQRIERAATVVQRLEAAGAVLAAKLTMGELAWGDVWFGGKTRNPWDLAQGSSGSSAGSAAAAAAGLVGFTIGSETLGSIVSPSVRCGTSGLRPSYGRVSRAGAMALSWSMDKLGPICRSVEDCALVFGAIYGPDGLDDTVVDAPFAWQPRASLAGMRLGYLPPFAEQPADQQAADAGTLEVLRALGAELVPLALPAAPIEALALILSAEAAAAFDELTRSGQDDLLVRQGNDAWPNTLRAARLIPAVEYIQANRIRTQLTQAMAGLFRQIDAYVAPALDEANLTTTNLTGHPAVVFPNGFSAEGRPLGITVIGRPYDEATILAIGHAYQCATDFHGRVPPL